MIPLTVSFFTKRSTSKKKGVTNALVYGLSIIVLFIVLGFLVGNALNKWSSSAFFNLTFFAIFMLFAFSFLGGFEITIPASWIEKSDKASERGGFIGIFFMAFTMVLVSFSCTGPLITWAINVKSTFPFASAIAMFGFGFIFALPFMFFAFFPGWLQSLPKSGSWLNTIKVSFGFIELAAAFKFYSNVDMAYHWNTLPRELFLVIWIVVFALLGMYLLGKLKFHHDDDLPKNDYGIPYLTVPRFLFATLSLCFAMYLVPGLWGAPLKLISGFPPATSYNEGKWTSVYGGSTSSNADAVNIPHTVKGPHDLDVFHDYDLALAYAKEKHKPLFVDFTGWSCVNCRKMEESVWSDEKVLNHLRKDFVVVSLYVDDREALPKEKQTKNYEGEIMKTTGDVYTNMQITRYNKNAQPYYVLLNGDEKPLNLPSPANFNVEQYNAFLEEGLKNFK
jgi:thiol:disulfide interchange protein DsbD